VVICVHVADAQGVVIRVQHAFRPDLGIGIGSPLLRVQQLLVIGIGVRVVGGCKGSCLGRGEDEVCWNLEAVLRRNSLARAGNRNRGWRSLLAGTGSRSRSRRSLLAGTGSRSSGRRGLLAGWLPDGFAEDVRMRDGSLEAREVGGEQERAVGQVPVVVGVAGQEVKDMSLVQSRVQASGRKSCDGHQGGQVLLHPVQDELVPRQEDRPELPIADFS
jgi:hypothetical protein